MNLLRYAGLIFLFILSSWNGMAWNSLSFRDAVCRAQEQRKDILVLYTSSRMGKAGERWQKALLNDPALEKMLSESFVLNHVQLPSKFRVKDIGDLKLVQLAAKHGVTVLPMMALCDNNGKIYARAFGGIASTAELSDKAQELLKLRDRRKCRDHALNQAEQEGNANKKETFLLDGMKGVPPSAWSTDYPDVMRQLDYLGSTAIAHQKAKKIDQQRKIDEQIASLMSKISVKSSLDQVDFFLKQIEKLERDPGLTGESRQFILVALKYPLLVRKSQLYYQGTVTMESEEAFDQSVDVLEQARDLDRETYWGREANKLREDLRKARLAAAKFD